MAADLNNSRADRELWRLAGTGDVELLDGLLADGANVNAADRTGVTALMRAAYHGQLQMVRALIARGADVKITDSGGLTALMMAEHADHEEIVEALLSFGAGSVPAAKAMPRSVGSIGDDSLGEAPAAKREAVNESFDDAGNDYVAKAGRTSRASTAYEPLEEGNDDFLAKPGTASRERTLHEPPEIWELVHTTEPESGFAANAVSRVSFPRLLMLTAALFTCAGVMFGLFYLRGADTGSAADAHPPEASPVKPTSRARPAAAKTKTNETRRINAPSRKPPDSTLVAELSTRDLPSAAVTEAIDYVFSEQLIAASDHANVAVTSPVRTPAAKTANKTTNTRAHLVRDDAQKTGKPARSRHGEEDSIVKREPKKLPTEPASPVTKTTNTQKPKVIQWP
jgi:hypothetical protein